MNSKTEQQLIQHSITRLIVQDLLLDFLYWPVWWYSAGLVYFFSFCLQLLKNQYERVALGVWVKNIFTPMYGQYDTEGRIISFFVRLFQIIVRSIFMVVWLALDLIFFIGWVVLPIYIVYQVILGIKVLW